MEEYRIIKQTGKGKEYSLWSFGSFEDCYVKLLELINNQKQCVNKEYYVENEFFKNEYPAYVGVTKFRIEVREVNKWKIYKEEKKNKNKKIIPFRGA